MDDRSMTDPFISIPEAITTSYMEFDEHNEHFKIVSESFEKEAHDL